MVLDSGESGVTKQGGPLGAFRSSPAAGKADLRETIHVLSANHEQASFPFSHLFSQQPLEDGAGFEA